MTRILKHCIALLAALALAAPLAGCGSDIPEPSGVPESTREVSVFFATGRSILEERRLVDAENVYLATLQEIMSAEPENNDVAIVQPVATIRSATLDKGVLTVDWDERVLAFEADPKEEIIAKAAFLRTLGQFPEVEKVRFTVDGKTEGTVGGKDVRAFWGTVSLIDQPWSVMRPEPAAEESATP